MIKIMLVDDESTAREAMGKMLDWQKFNTRVIGSFGNALEALDEMANEMPDILITDIKMPVVSGLELIERAKEMNPLLQCIVLSGFDEFDLAQSAMEKGVRYYLLKPCNKAKLENAITACISQMEIDRKRISNNGKNREIIIDKMIAELLDLSSDSAEISIERIREIMTAYNDQQIWKDCTVTLILKCLSQIDSQTAICMIREIYDDQMSCFKLVQRTLQKIEESELDVSSFVDKIRKYVNENYQNPSLTLKYVAEQVVYMNPQYIGKQFYKQVGVKFSQYLLNVRMDHAQQLLLGQERLKMFEIAERIGLGNNVQYFYLLFKRHCGMTPKEYQEHYNL